MNEVYIVYVIYQYDGYSDTEVYSTKEKAIEAADQLISEFKKDGYEVAFGFEDIAFRETMAGNVCYIRLNNGDGDVEITVEQKVVH